MARKLFALLVGIDEYPHASDLKGCVNDVDNMAAYLNEREDFTADIVCLKNKDATKENIVSTFREHLGKATKEDVSLFYFAGHGVEEKTSIPAFQKASNTQNIQTFLCYSSDPHNSSDPNSTCLADKEMRYLSQQLNSNGSDFYVVMDCCHSGEGFRDSEDSKKRQYREDAIEERTWEGFIFHDQLHKDDFSRKSLPEIIPMPMMVQMSACRNVEVAWEAKSEEGKSGGLFSISLLKILRDAGPGISNRSLQDRLGNYLRTWNNKKQTPQFYVSKEGPQKMYQGFLGAELSSDPYQSRMVYNPSKGWIIGLGYVHGIDDKSGPLSCKVFLDDEKEEGLETRIKKVYPGHSLIEIEEAWGFDVDSAYVCEIEIPLEPISVYLEAKDKVKKLIHDSIPAFSKDMGTDFVNFVDSENIANYSVRFKGDSFKICWPFDHKELVLQTKNTPDRLIRQLFNQLFIIAKWEFALNIRNPYTNLDKNLPPELQGKPLSINLDTIDERGNRKAILAENGEYILHLDRVNPEHGYKFKDLRMSVKNHSKKELYCSLLYLGQTFEVFTNLLSTESIVIHPGETYHVDEGNMMEVSLQNFVYEMNWEGYTEHFKLVASTEKFNLADLDQDALPSPLGGLTRKFKFKAAGTARQAADWITEDIKVFTVNPEFQKENT